MTTPNQTLHLFLMAALCYSIKCQKANLDPPAVLNTPSQRPFPIAGLASPGLSALQSDLLILAKEWNSLRVHCRPHKTLKSSRGTRLLAILSTLPRVFPRHHTLEGALPGQANSVANTIVHPTPQVAMVPKECL